MKLAAIAGGSSVLYPLAAEPSSAPSTAADLPKGSNPRPLVFSHFPDRLHAFVWRNWALVSVGRMARVVGAQPADILRIGKAMGLSDPPRLTADQQRRSYITVIRRNWHLLPYEQLLELLGWTPDQMAFTLREDDFLFVKLGNLKPRCEPIRYAPPSEAVLARERAIAKIVREDFPSELEEKTDPLFGFVARLSQPPKENQEHRKTSRFTPRYCYSYFALYGDPLLDKAIKPYPDGYLARLAAAGVDGVWLQAVLHKLAPFPWDETLSGRHEERLASLRDLVKDAAGHGMGVYLYLNEPRSMPLRFFEKRPELKGVVEGEHGALCTSHPDVQKWIRDSVAFVCRAVPDLAGFFSISASENLSNCWSHSGGAKCPRCGARSPSEVIAEVATLFDNGIKQSQSKARLIVWDWGWADDWVEGIIERLPADAALMSVSEWSMPTRRGGIENTVGEYSISTIGPGPRARKHWALARKRGLKTLAKIQAGNTWELSAVPYIPALENVGRHTANLLQEHVDGLMLGWTLGGYPSPNLEVAMEMAHSAPPDPGTPVTEKVVRAMAAVARRRFGDALAPAMVAAWRQCSTAFSEFPFDGSLVYNAPMQFGPSNLLWSQPSGYRATMVGFPYDDLDGWRGPYPAEVFISQFEKVAKGFETALESVWRAVRTLGAKPTAQQQSEATQELNVMEAAAIHFQTTANQARVIQLRRRLATAPSQTEAEEVRRELRQLLLAEITLARRLHAIQNRDSRIGFEATNQYYYVPLDLVEKVLNCRDLLDHWVPPQARSKG